jgi:hypothetical protein
LEVASSRFWNQHYLSGDKILSDLWDHRAGLELAEKHILALLVSEMANGHIAVRRWASMLDDNRLETLLALTLANILFLCARAEDFGVGQDPLLETVALVVELAVTRLEFERAFSVFSDPWKPMGREHVSDDARRYIMGIVLSRMKWQLAKACSQACSRVSLDDDQEDSGTEFWHRFRPEKWKGTSESPKAHKCLIIQDTKRPCEAGICLEREVGCPLVEGLDEVAPSEESARKFLLGVRTLIQYRLR